MRMKSTIVPAVIMALSLSGCAALTETKEAYREKYGFPAKDVYTEPMAGVDFPEYSTAGKYLEQVEWNGVQPAQSLPEMRKLPRLTESKCGLRMAGWKYYAGGCKRGSANGIGYAVSDEGNWTLIGEFVNGSANGSGGLYGEWYSSEWGGPDAVPSYAGAWRNGRRHGLGIYRKVHQRYLSKVEEIAQGNWKDDRRNGEFLVEFRLDTHKEKRRLYAYSRETYQDGFLVRRAGRSAAEWLDLVYAYDVGTDPVSQIENELFMSLFIYPVMPIFHPRVANTVDFAMHSLEKLKGSLKNDKTEPKPRKETFSFACTMSLSEARRRTPNFAGTVEPQRQTVEVAYFSPECRNAKIEYVLDKACDAGRNKVKNEASCHNACGEAACTIQRQQLD